MPRVGCVYRLAEDKSKVDKAAVEALVREVIEISSINRLTLERRANVKRVDIDFSKTIWVLS